MARKLTPIEQSVRASGGQFRAVDQIMPKSSMGEDLAVLGQSIAAAGFEIQRQKDTARLIADISDFQINTQQMMQDMTQRGTGAKPFTEAVLEKFKESGDNFINQQPAYLRQTAREKVMGLQTKVASQAIGFEAQMAAQQVAMDSVRTLNNLTNMTRIGQMSESEALAEAKQFAANLPMKAQASFMQDANNIVKSASMNLQITQDPNALKSAIESGKYNDVRPEFVQSMLSRADSEIQRRQTEQIRKQAAVVDNLRKDPHKAFAIATDNQNPSRLESYEWQQSAGVPALGLSLVSNDEAKSVAHQIENAASIDQIFGVIQDFTKDVGDDKNMRDIMVQNVQNRGELPPAFSALVGTLSSENYDVRNPELRNYAETLFTIAQDKKNVSVAKDILKARYGESVNETVVMQQVAEKLKNEISAIQNSYGAGTMGVRAVGDFIQVNTDAALVMASKAGGGKLDDAYKTSVKQIVSALGGSGNTAREGYTLPPDLANMASESDMDAIRKSIIGRADIAVPSFFEDIQAQDAWKKSILRDSIWADTRGYDAGQVTDGLTLRFTNGDTVRDKAGQPLFYSYDRIMREILIVKGKQIGHDLTDRRGMYYKGTETRIKSLREGF